MPLRFAPANADKALPLHIVSEGDSKDWIAKQTPAHRAWLKSQGFVGKLGTFAVLPADSGKPKLAVLGWGDAATRARGRFHVGKAANVLPEGIWRIEGNLDQAELEEAALGWLLSRYRFDRYRKQPESKARLVAPKGIDATRIEVIAAGEGLTRDLINTPASDMGPADLENAALAMAGEFGAETRVITGEALLSENFPMIHAVGRAAPRAPRLIEFNWGSKGPQLTLVGKGVCFDTGGLDIKPAASMGLMKKDMGGAATVLGLAMMIMALDLPLRLRVLIPAVENSISGAAFRPQDILTSRKGLTVEVNNTDAEGRLVLADALAYACEGGELDLLISMATLTGAARVALGADVPPFFTGDDALAEALARSAETVRDPIWRMPFWDPYEPMIEPGIADLDNAPKGGMAGAITAALFLRRFVEHTRSWVHFDIAAWNHEPRPHGPVGGEAQGIRALEKIIAGRYA